MAELREVIKALESLPADAVLEEGIAFPHSYRGWYDHLAFVPLKRQRVSDALKTARSAVGATCHGWKGGEYKMDEWTEVHLAEPGELGPPLCLRCLVRLEKGGRRGK